MNMWKSGWFRWSTERVARQRQMSYEVGQFDHECLSSDLDWRLAVEIERMEMVRPNEGLRMVREASKRAGADAGESLGFPSQPV